MGLQGRIGNYVAPYARLGYIHYGDLGFLQPHRCKVQVNVAKNTSTSDCSRIEIRHYLYDHCIPTALR